MDPGNVLLDKPLKLPSLATEEAMAQWWLTERQRHVISRWLQLHDGYGYTLTWSGTRTPALAR